MLCKVVDTKAETDIEAEVEVEVEVEILVIVVSVIIKPILKSFVFDCFRVSSHLFYMSRIIHIFQNLVVFEKMTM